jgi:hypothetical protein
MEAIRTVFRMSPLIVPCAQDPPDICLRRLKSGSLEPQDPVASLDLKLSSALFGSFLHGDVAPIRGVTKPARSRSVG